MSKLLIVFVIDLILLALIVILFFILIKLGTYGLSAESKFYSKERRQQKVQETAIRISKKFNTPGFSISIGGLLFGIIALISSMGYNAHAKFDPLDFSILQLTGLVLATPFGTGVFHKYENKILRRLCSLRSLIFLGGVFLLIYGQNTVNEKIWYFRYHRIQGRAAEIIGFIHIIIGIFVIYTGLNFNKIEQGYKNKIQRLNQLEDMGKES